jgi:polyvinyl alcohol dehydrogenase (cytochrome)
MRATTQRSCWLFCAALSILPSMAFAESKHSRQEWPMSGQNVQNTASNDEEREISTSNVTTLAPKWVATTGGDVSARAAVVRGAVYFPDFGGNLWALDADTGAVIWQVQLSTIFGLKPGIVVSRTTPAVQHDTVYIGTQAGPDYTPQGGLGAQSGANLLAFNAKTGALRWMLMLDTQSAVAGLTASPAILEDVIHIGVSGVAQEVGVANDAEPCCSFIGSEVAVDARTQKILWKTPMAPSGYTGTSVWGSNAVVDAQRKSVFIGTGNNYSTPTAPPMSSVLRQAGHRRSAFRPTTMWIQSSRWIAAPGGSNGRSG